MYKNNNLSNYTNQNISQNKIDLKVNINDKLNTIFDKDKFIFNLELALKINNNWVNEIIIGKTSKYLITKKNTFIDLTTIEDIKIK